MTMHLRSLALGKLRQENHKFKASSDILVRTLLKEKKEGLGESLICKTLSTQAWGPEFNSPL